MPLDSWLAREARKVLDGVPWPEAVGFRLSYGEMDPGLSIWMDAIPPDMHAWPRQRPRMARTVRAPAGVRSQNKAAQLSATVHRNVVWKLCFEDL